MNLPITLTVTPSRHIDPSWLQLYRHPHDVEILNFNSDSEYTGRTYLGDGKRGNNVRSNTQPTETDPSGATLPEVYRLLPSQTVPLRPEWIHLWKDLNPELSVEVFCTLLDNHYAWTNQTGWPGRYNCLTGRDAGQKDPTFHASLVCGGAVLKGKEAGDKTLAIESMSAGGSAPDAAWVLDRPWLWYWGTEVNPKGGVTFITRPRESDRVRIPVRVPLVTQYPVYLPLCWLDKLPLGFIPSDPRWMPS